ncbi:ADP-ribose glycohydrolase MACROD1-like [Cyprinus carpio]|uniref:ADP-ribose glycohydrolase MACROD1-like n=1 Tax=Cyprinus carpio TaxID=7962 RepID=A0A9Q9X3U3_CYPCA|nr:ADP-ribose glycohydrolase MACROD1-like [Cyprinus carpio]
MAFQMSKLAARVWLFKSVGFPSSAGNRCPTHLGLISRLALRSFHALKALPSPGLLRKADRWEKVSTASKSLHRRSGGAVKARRITGAVVGAVGVSAVALASLSTSTLHAMSARPDLNLDSESSDWTEAKKKLCSMDKEKRRETYRVDFIPLEKIPVWSPSGDSSCKPRYKVNEELNKKISLFSGDITKLEIDAVANAANKTLLGGGGVGDISPDAQELRELRDCVVLKGHSDIRVSWGFVAFVVLSVDGVPFVTGAGPSSGGKLSHS